MKFSNKDFFSQWRNPEEILKITEEILNGKVHWFVQWKSWNKTPSEQMSSESYMSITNVNHNKEKEKSIEVVLVYLFVAYFITVSNILISLLQKVSFRKTNQVIRNMDFESD